MVQQRNAHLRYKELCIPQTENSLFCLCNSVAVVVSENIFKQF